MNSSFYTNYSEVRFIDKLKRNIDTCNAFYFSISFIKKAGLNLIAPNIRAAVKRGAAGKIITSTYQNFTDIDSLKFFYELQSEYPERFACNLDKDCFCDSNGNVNGFHSKGYLFEFDQYNELLVGSSNITVYALLKNIEWDVSLIDAEDEKTYGDAKKEFRYLWERTYPLSGEIIAEYTNRLLYSIERWDMDYSVANSSVKPNYMQRKALKELNRIRALGAARALVCSAAGSGKTVLAAFDVLNFNPQRMLYIVQEGSILMKSYETFSRIFGNDKTYGIYNQDYKDFDADFVFSTNVTMANSLNMFDAHDFDYIIIDEAHHATADTYRQILDYFKPQFLLGITATPERMDGKDVFGLFDQNVPYELRLRDAIINKLVVPFHYYGIRDELIEYGIKETKGHKFVEQFSKEDHCDFIYKMIEQHKTPGQKLKAIAFCKDRAHAIRMSQAMEEFYPDGTCYLTGRNGVGERIRAYKDLQDDNTSLQILFTVDILNEGVDIPAVNMVLFLRPTDSQTIFIQQLGRGLRNYPGKKYVTVLDFIGNDYKRSVQIAFALGNLARNFLVEKKLIANLVVDNFTSIGLAEYGVEIHIDELSKKEILSYIDEVNFNTKNYLSQDYGNFKKYLNTGEYPKHIDYLNNDYAPDLIRFIQSKIDNRKNGSYYTFLKAIGEEDIPAFNERQEQFVKYVSSMLPIVRPYEYMIIEKILDSAGSVSNIEVQESIQEGYEYYSEQAYEHALHFMIQSGYFNLDNQRISFADIDMDVELEQYLYDLLEYGLGKYEIDYADSDRDSVFALWNKYRKEQVQLLLLNNPGDIMTGTKVYDDTAYLYVTVIKASSTKLELQYKDGYIDETTFQWETVAGIKEKELNSLKASKQAYVFVRKIENEDGITLPFTFIGTGKMQIVNNSQKENGAHLFRIYMDVKAPEDIYFDFKLPE